MKDPLHPARSTLVAELRRGLRGEVRCGPRALRTYARDFGGIVSRRPLAVVAPRGEEDVARVFEVAQRWRLPVAVRGAGHSANGQTLSSGGIVLAMRSLAAPATLQADGSAELGAGSRWREVERVLSRRNRAVPVLADYLDLTVGGTLAVGCYGVDSVSHGAQVDAVERLRIVTPDGAARWCSTDEDAELFHYSLAGQGRLAVITRAVLRTVPRSKAVAFFRCRHRNLSDLAQSLAWTADAASARPEVFKALVSRGRTISLYGFQAPSLRAAAGMPPPAWLPVRPERRLALPWYRPLRSATVSLWVACHGRGRRLWCDYLLDHAGFVTFARLVESLERQDAFAGRLVSVYVLGVRRPAGAAALPFEACGPPDGRVRLGIGLYAMIPHGDEPSLARVEQAMRRCLEACLELGGRPYLYGAHRLSEEQRQRLYGPALARLGELAAVHDPAGVLGRDKLLG